MIDFQGDFCDADSSFIAAVGASSGTKYTRESLQPAKKVLTAARTAGIRIIHTLEAHLPDLSDLTASKDRRSRNTERPDVGVIGCDGGNGRMLVRGSPCNGLMDDVAMVDGEIAIHKPGKGAFCDTELRARLDELGVTHLIFCGVTTECCVQSTMREANDRGFDSILVEDATASCVPRLKMETIGQVTAFGAIVGCSATCDDVVQALDALSAAYQPTPPQAPSSITLTKSSPPVIDVSCLVRSLNRPFSHARRAVDSECLKCARELDDACRLFGFFYVVGHNILSPFETVKDFFSLDLQQKLRLRTIAGEVVGYDLSGTKNLQDESKLDDKTDGGTLQESYIVRKSPPSERIDETNRIEGRWPDETVNGPVKPGFKEHLTVYHNRCEDFLRILLRGIAIGLGLAADMFDCYTKDAMTQMQLLKYPTSSADEAHAQGAPSCVLKLLEQDENCSLEVFEDGNWLPAPNKEGTLLVGVGDVLKTWSASRYQSAPHRVIRSKLEDVKGMHLIAVYYNCDCNAPIDPNYLFPNGMGVTGALQQRGLQTAAAAAAAVPTTPTATAAATTAAPS